MKTPEGEVKKGIRKNLKFVKAYVFEPVQTGYGKATLDSLNCVPTTKSCPKCGHAETFGQFVAIEAKAPGKKPTARQRRTIKEIKKAGGIVYVVTGSKWEAQ